MRFASAAAAFVLVANAALAADPRVPVGVHGQKMKDALAAAGVPVEWVVYASEGHGFLLEENRFDFYRRVAAYLDKIL